MLIDVLWNISSSWEGPCLRFVKFGIYASSLWYSNLNLTRKWHTKNFWHSFCFTRQGIWLSWAASFWWLVKVNQRVIPGDDICKSSIVYLGNSFNNLWRFLLLQVSVLLIADGVSIWHLSCSSLNLARVWYKHFLLRYIGIAFLPGCKSCSGSNYFFYLFSPFWRCCRFWTACMRCIY